ncbi:hypothetical protein NPIL_626681 [Nephila pilipes]|uniref:Histone H2A n=1 Tax=Nephila pilipes TaxID=299642 RepID=A0A8X6QW08_NEPPI|nr:hypothetical protein NPIL_626681 [Nephila pilipes]
MVKHQKSSNKKSSGSKGRDMLINVQAIHDVLTQTTEVQVQPIASVYLTAILQFITAEVIETALNSKLGQKQESTTLNTDDINKAIQADPDLMRLFNIT